MSLKPDDAPPPFELYEAESFNVAAGDVVSHDPHLNTDGEALYRFLLEQSEVPPQLHLHCRSTHEETRWRTVQGDNNNQTRQESYTETVVDFDFRIDLSNLVLPHVTHWSLPDDQPAYRGRMCSELETVLGKRKATRDERKEFNRTLKDRRANGLPPWYPDGPNTALRSSKSPRQWADEYTMSPKHLKEFQYDKIIYGWNFDALESAVLALILSNKPFYPGNPTVHFRFLATKVYVRPDNRLSRTLSNKWLKFLLIITFIFPFIWLFKRFHSAGGGRWRTCGGAYGIKRTKTVPDLLSDELPAYHDLPGPSTSSSTMPMDNWATSDEMTWLNKWQPTILRCVHSRYQSSTPLRSE
ncbi:hypothetical protein K435DRAFT_772584 [Dendrothele bispora CBS 962.96]|uniref:Uncharacterized protein n=1 Tax=Dendrothele bispora (strain CBS 962.96) TaxID=1314807 RepID=A0A4V4HIS0_DENBC|nr:hypothetical protein K435DRAFT_772584 [Dendrothele bispora CBS 962.96]